MQNNFSYPLKLEDISSAPKQFNINASPKELNYIAEILKVPAVKSFHVEIIVKLNKPQHLVEVNGKLTSDIEQISIISLEQFIKQYHFEFARLFDTKMTLTQQRELEDFDDINAEIPDIMEDGQIDLKAIALEALALELDDFPRKSGEKFHYTPDFDPDEDKPQNPFAVLQKLKK